MSSTINAEPDTWLTVQDAADRRGLTYRRVIQWVRDGFLPSSKPGGVKGQHLIKLADLDALLAAAYKPATHGPLASVTR